MILGLHHLPLHGGHGAALLSPPHTQPEAVERWCITTQRHWSCVRSEPGGHWRRPEFNQYPLVSAGLWEGQKDFWQTAVRGVCCMRPLPFLQQETENQCLRVAVCRLSWLVRPWTLGLVGAAALRQRAHTCCYAPRSQASTAPWLSDLPYP